MRISERLQTASRLFLDTAPIIYYVEANPRYLSRVESVFDLLDSGRCLAVASPITLAECLVAPYRLGRADLQQAFSDLLSHNSHEAFRQRVANLWRRSEKKNARLMAGRLDRIGVLLFVV